MDWGRWRRRLVYLVPFGIAAAGAFVLGEFYVRYGYDYMVPPPWQAERTLTYSPAVFARHIFAAEEQTKSEIPGIVYHVNRLGYRGEDFPFEKAPGTVRIMFYGGSSVFDGWSTEGEDWPHRAGSLLHSMGFSSVEAINAGIPGHATIDSVGRLLTEGHLLNPDIVLLSSAWNDIKFFRDEQPILRALKPLSDRADPRLHYNNFLDRLLGNYSQLYIRLRQNYYTWALDLGPEGQVKERERSASFGEMGPEQYRLNVAAFVDISRDAGIVPVLVSEPHLAAADNTDAMKARIYYQYVGLTHEGLLTAYDAIDRILHDVAVEKHVLLIDASAELSGRDELFVDHGHMTAQGSVEMARVIADALAAELRRRGVAAN